MKEINLTTKIGVYLIEECSEVEKNLLKQQKKRHKKTPMPPLFRIQGRRSCITTERQNSFRKQSGKRSISIWIMC